MRALPPPHGEQRARRTAAAQLHTDPKDKRAEHHRYPDRRHQPDHRLAEQAARPQRREKQQHRQRQHHHLRAQAGATPVIDKHAPGRSEAERGMVESQAQRGADGQQQHLARADVVLQEQAAQHQQDKGHQRRDGLARGGRSKRGAHGVSRFV